METSIYTEGVLKELKESIKYDVNSGIDKSITEYMDSALEHLKRQFELVNKRSRYQVWTIQNRQELLSLWMTIQPEVLSGIERLVQDIKRKKMTKEIKAMSAKAVIKDAMQEAGLKHHFTGQTHRAKVSVLLPPSRALTIYISYKKMNEQLPRIIESLKIIRQELESLGGNVSINKAFNISEFV